LVGRFRNAEVRHFHAAVELDEDIAGLDVTMHQTACVSRSKRVGYLGGDVGGACRRECAVQIDRPVKDGDSVPAGTVLLTLEGNARAMLAAERSALNTLQHLSGIATLAARYVAAIGDGGGGQRAQLLDTRKTVPGLRLLEKYAARMGGAENHRMRMDDGLLIKDNHVAVAGGVGAAVRLAKAAETGLQVQVEVDRIDQIEEALTAGADRLLLDNMSAETLREAVAVVAGRVPLEASGGINLDTIAGIAASGVDYVSVGRITQSAPAVDIGLDYALQ